MSLKNSWKEECGVFGIWRHPEAAKLTYLGLYAMQHRGQESAGIVSLDSKAATHLIHKDLGLVADIFTESHLVKLTGDCAIGHVRYSTTGSNSKFNAQPLTSNLLNGPVSVAHNGNIVNSIEVKKELQAAGAIFQATNDTEILLHLIARNPSNDLRISIEGALKKLSGAYSLVIMGHQAMYAVRDPFGFRPLVLGELNGNYVVASETCAFDLIGAKFVREVAPGEILEISDTGLKSFKFNAETVPAKRKSAHCVFEHIYFSRPDSVVFGKSVYLSRRRFGEELAKESFVDADVVIPVPDSGVPAALGFSKVSGVPFDYGIIRNHYIGRTFIQPTQSVRDIGVKIKLNPQVEILKGKRVIVIDDSLVRGTTSQKIISMIRQAGALEVHLRIASPPTTGPCFYGVDTPQKSELIASQNSLEDIRKHIGADSIAYLSEAGMWRAVNSGPESYCAACFNGDYPTILDSAEIKKKTEISSESKICLQ